MELTYSGIRLDRFVSQQFPTRSRTAWQRDISRGNVTVNGKVVRANFVLSPGDVVSVNTVVESPVLASDMEVYPEIPKGLVIYLDADLVVVNKPVGLVVHPSRGHYDNSLVHQIGSLLEREKDDWRPGIVHRLDQDTSGLLLVARHELSRVALSKAIADREVHRDYLAVVHGHLEPANGVIDAPIARNPRNRLKMGIVFGGKEARTHYRTVAQWRDYSLVQCTLETGRTHQIRVHLASIGRPVVGDPLYGSSPEFGMAGQALHAARIAFTQPMTGRALCFFSDVPRQWNALWKSLGPSQILDPALFPHLAQYPCGTMGTETLLVSSSETEDFFDS